jgi:hypothetical protein
MMPTDIVPHVRAVRDKRPVAKPGLLPDEHLPRPRKPTAGRQAICGSPAYLNPGKAATGPSGSCPPATQRSMASAR